VIPLGRQHKSRSLMHEAWQTAVLLLLGNALG